MLEKVLVTGYAAEGKSLARQDGKVIFIEGAVPGDVVDVFVSTNRKDYGEGKATRFHELSAVRTEPFCSHFGVCGGCKWQMLPYSKQLEYKHQEVVQHFRRIGRLELPEVRPVIGSEKEIHYRNKLEFTFSNREYLTEPPPRRGKSKPTVAPAPGHELEQPVQDADPDGDAKGLTDPAPITRVLGYHAPRVFDKIIDISECYLMDDVNNRIRNTIRSFALENNYSFYDARQHTGWLRNIIIRYCTTGELMVNICIGYEDTVQTKKLMDFVLSKVPSITSLLYTVNTKWNDSIFDLEPVVFHGKDFVTEQLAGFYFRIGPKSFFQTNTGQAEKLYSIVKEFAGLTGKEVVYDLYCGTGSIGIFLSRVAKKIIGVDVVSEAIEDARLNAAINQAKHASFFTGDVIRVCDDQFFALHGRPDVIVTDPPRAGMHEKLVNKLLEIEAPKIVYVSCNTATQARDLALLSIKYQVDQIQPVDMFPHTHHIECVVSLTLK